MSFNLEEYLHEKEKINKFTNFKKHILFVGGEVSFTENIDTQNDNLK
jgi:hypothetical protein